MTLRQAIVEELADITVDLYEEPGPEYERWMGLVDSTPIANPSAELADQRRLASDVSLRLYEAAEEALRQQLAGLQAGQVEFATLA